MRFNNNNRGEERIARPFCQATGCFNSAEVYVVVKETEEPCYIEIDSSKSYRAVKKNLANEKEATEFDGFKLILYFCSRHDNDFRYLIKGSELEVSKRRDLLASPKIKKSAR